MLTGKDFDYHCHSNLTRAVLPYGLTEFDVHDVLNVFQCTGMPELRVNCNKHGSPWLRCLASSNCGFSRHTWLRRSDAVQLVDSFHLMHLIHIKAPVWIVIVFF